MNKDLTLDTSTFDDKKLQIEIDCLFAQMDEADLRIKHNQDETDILRAETKAIIATLEVK